jgi:D-lactate dehydrogenase
LKKKQLEGDAQDKRMKDEKDIEKLFDHSRNNNIPITFRAAGTSLSGQSVTNGILVEVKDHWNKFKVLDKGRKILLQPGVNGGTANKILSRYRRKIGPDPASLNVACIGGIVSNNSSGMICGTEYNSYNTLSSIRFILPNGRAYDSDASGESERFKHSEPKLFKAILDLKKYIFPKTTKTKLKKLQVHTSSLYSISSPKHAEQLIEIVVLYMNTTSKKLSKMSIMDSSANIGGNT